MKIREIILETGDPSGLSEFYNHVLELRVNEKAEGFTIHLDEGKIHFKTAGKEKKPFYHFALTIPSNKIEAAAAWLSSRLQLLYISDYESTIAEFTNWLARSVYFIDPAGNIVELIARQPLNNPANGAFSSSMISAVSEMGIVLPALEFESGCKALMEQFDLGYFSRQPPLPSFRALGNDEGLFIVVPEQRNWYPTNLAAGNFPLTIVFENNGRSFTWSS